MKLTIKHIAPYLPYGLKITFSDGKLEWNTLNAGHLQFEDSNYLEIRFKPLLRPLSDLTKEIEHNGEKFVPIEKLEIDSSIVDFIISNNQLIIKPIDCDFIYVIDIYNNIIQKLSEWHIDFQNLIEQGLAIDLNTVKN